MHLLGNPGRGRPAPEFDFVEGEPVKTGAAMPPGCVRVLHDPFGRFECSYDCSGRQRDNSCLCEIVTACAEHGVTPEFEVSNDGYWDYIGQEF